MFLAARAVNGGEKRGALDEKTSQRSLKAVVEASISGKGGFVEERKFKQSRAEQNNTQNADPSFPRECRQQTGATRKPQGGRHATARERTTK
jgi:hypothetical protein